MIHVPFVKYNGKGTSMKRYIYVSIVVLSGILNAQVATQNTRFHPSFPVVDAIIARVYGQEGCHIITKSDLERPGLGGQLRSLNDLIFEGMVYLDALKHKVIIDDEAVDKYLQMIQRENNVTLEQIEQSFKDAGYTVAEGREQLRVMQTVNTMVNLRVNKNLVVPRKDVELYFKTYPEYTPEEFMFQYAFVAEDGSVDQKERVSRALKATDQHDSFDWTKPFAILETDIAEEKKYLCTLSLGAISEPNKVEGGYELYRMVEKKEARLKTLDERYHQIVEILRRPKMKELQDEYRKKLEAVSSVVVL
jgi:hypothetical protein